MPPRVALLIFSSPDLSISLTQVEWFSAVCDTAFDTGFLLLINASTNHVWPSNTATTDHLPFNYSGDAIDRSAVMLIINALRSRITCSLLGYRSSSGVDIYPRRRRRRRGDPPVGRRSAAYFCPAAAAVARTVSRSIWPFLCFTTQTILKEQIVIDEREETRSFPRRTRHLEILIQNKHRLLCVPRMILCVNKYYERTMK